MIDVERRPVDVAIVGGGPAGAALATRLARGGRTVTLLERSPRWRWRACGVFTSPAAVRELRELGLPASAIERVARPIPAMRVTTAHGTGFRITYGAHGADARDGGDGASGGPGSAVGFDRAALDEALLELAAAAGATILRGHAVDSIDLPLGRQAGRLAVRGPGGARTLRAGLVVGADGIRSIVAREAGVALPAWLGRRVGLTWHVRDPAGEARHDARMVVLPGAYCGLAPVPGGRLNVGIVLWGRERLRALATLGAAVVGQQVLAEALASQPRVPSGPAPDPLDAAAGAAPLGHRVRRRAGEGWLLVGDAAGFLDPFTGEGLGRALVSARLAAAAVTAGSGMSPDLAAYEREMRVGFAAKDLVSLLVQAFLARPLLFEYAARRLATRERLRETMGLVMGDLVPARRALDLRFLAGLLAP